MTTNVNISTDYVHPGKRLRVLVVDPSTGAIYRDLSADQAKVEEHGGKYEFETVYVHDGSKLIVTEDPAP